MTYTGLEHVGNWSQIGSLLVGSVALCVAMFSLNRNRKLQRENIAANIWREYEKTALSFPQFFVPEEMFLDFDCLTLNGDREKFQQYQWFVSFTLMACEEVLSAHRSRNDWKITVERQLVTHRKFIVSPWFRDREFINTLSPPLQSLVENLRRKCQAGLISARRV